MTDTDLAIRRDSVILPLNTNQVAGAMAAYQDGLKSILDDTDYQAFKDKKTGETRRFPKRSAWRKIAYWFNLDLELIGEDIERDGRGEPIRARIRARAVHPNGRYADGDGGCSITERGFSKLEHDIPATAATRAMNRAISNLVGMGEVSAEEIDSGPDPEPFGPPASREDRLGITKAAHVLWRENKSTVELVDRLQKDAGGYLPRIVARAIMLVAAHRPTPTEQAPPDEGETGADVSAREDTEPPDEPATPAQADEEATQPAST